MEPDIEAVAEQVFVALADPTRRTILAALATAGPSTVTDLAARLPITRQAIAKHLGVLAEAGLVTPTRTGRENRFTASATPLADAERWLRSTGPRFFTLPPTGSSWATRTRASQHRLGSPTRA